MTPRRLWIQPTPLEVEAEGCRRDLRAFIAAAWSVIEPGTPFVPGFHIDAMAEHLQAVTDGQIRRLVINIPPRHMKSLLVSVLWPAWEWASRPSRRWLCASYARELAIRDNTTCRRLITSDWYQQRWGNRVRLASDQRRRMRFETTATGVRLATSVGGPVTGEGGDRIIVDDPHNVRSTWSTALRTAALRWWDESMSTRLNDPARSAIIIVMQRLHEADLTGHVLAQGGYEHLCLPAEYDGRTCVTVVGRADRRTTTGDLLWPARFDRANLEDLKRRLGSVAAAGQLQQQPVPEGGAIFKRVWFPIRTVPVASDEIVTRCRFWDCAATPSGGDYTVGVKLAKTKTGRYIVEDVVRGQWSAGEVDRILAQTAHLDGPRVRIREEQEGGSAGKSVIEARRRQLAGFDYRGVPATGDKVTRYQPFAVQAEAGQVELAAGAWNGPWLDELCLVPVGIHDDQADATAGAFASLALEPRVTAVKLKGF